MAVTWIPVNIKKERDLWDIERDKGIGGNGVSTILGYDDYKSNLEYFYEKIGYPTYDIGNIATYCGSELEDFIENLWSYYDGDPKNHYNNIKTKNKVAFSEYCGIDKDGEPCEAFVINDKYPHLRPLMDRRILPSKRHDDNGALEMKNTQQSRVNQYAEKIVTGHVIQNITQTFCAEYSFGELAYFLDNKKFECNHIDIYPYADLINGIVEETKIFWNNVIEGRKLYTQRFHYKEIAFNSKKVAEIDREIERLEPPVQNTDLYLKFLNEKFKDRKSGIGVIKGTEDHYQAAKRHRDLKLQIKELEKSIITEEISLKNAIGPSNRMEFGKGQGHVSWTVSSNGTRPFINKVI